MKLPYKNGFTLVELMVAMVVGSIAIASAYASYDVIAKQYEKVKGVTAMQSSSRSIMRMIERDIRMAGFKWRNSKGTITFGSISEPIKITDSGNKCCDAVTVTYDYRDEASKKVERHKIHYTVKPYQGRNRLYRKRDILFPKVRPGNNDVLADYVEDLQFNSERNSNCYDRAKLDLSKILDAQKTFFKNNGYYWSENVLTGGTGGTCGSVKKWAYKNGIKQYPISWHQRPRASYDRCSYGKSQNRWLNKYLTKSDPVAGSTYNVMGTRDDRNSWENGKFKPKGFRAYAWGSVCKEGVPKNSRVFNFEFLLWIDNKGNTGVGVGSMARGGRRYISRSFTRTTNWSKPNSVPQAPLIEINLTLRTKKEFGPARSYTKKSYAGGNYNINKNDAYKRQEYSSTVLIRNPL